MLFFFFLFFSKPEAICVVSSNEYKKDCIGIGAYTLYSSVYLFDFSEKNNTIFIHESIEPNQKIVLSEDKIYDKSFRIFGEKSIIEFRGKSIKLDTLSFENAGGIKLKDTIEDFTANEVINVSFIEKENEKTKININSRIEIAPDAISFNDFKSQTADLNVRGSDIYEILFHQSSFTLFTSNGKKVIHYDSYKNISLSIENNSTIAFDSESTTINELPTLLIKKQVSILFANNVVLNVIRKGTLLSDNCFIKGIEKEALSKYFSVKGTVNYIENDAVDSLCIFTKHILRYNNCIYRQTDDNSITLSSSFHNLYFVDNETSYRLDFSSCANESINIHGVTNKTTVLCDTLNYLKDLSIYEISIAASFDSINMRNLTMGLYSNIVISQEESKPFDVEIFECDSICSFVDNCDFHAKLMLIVLNNSRGMGYIYDGMVDSLTIYIRSGICLEDILFNSMYVSFSFSDGNRLPVVNKALNSTVIYLEGHQSRMITIRNNFSMYYEMLYFPHIHYSYNDSISFFFDNSWEKNCVFTDEKPGFFLNDKAKNIITSTSKMSVIKNLFDLGDYKFDSSSIKNGAYCISQKESECGEIETVLLYKEKDFVNYNFSWNNNHETRIRVVSSDLTIDMSMLENISIRLFALSCKHVTLLFAPTQVIKSLELSLLTVDMKPIANYSVVTVVTFVGDTSFIRMHYDNVKFNISNYVRVNFENYRTISFNFIKSKSLHLELVNPYNSSQLAKVLIGIDRFVLELSNQTRATVSFNLMRQFSYTQYSATKSMITISTDSDFGYVLPRVPDLYMLGADVCFLFSDEWFDMKTCVMKKGLIRVGENDEISVFSKNQEYPDIFDFDDVPKLIPYMKSDNRICLYHTNSTTCPYDFFPFQYKNNQSIGVSTIVLLQKKVFFFIAESNETYKPSLRDDILAIDSVSLSGNEQQYAHCTSTLKVNSISLYNVSLSFDITKEKILIYNITMFGKSSLYCNYSVIFWAHSSTKCFSNITNSFSKNAVVYLEDHDAKRIDFVEKDLIVSGINISFSNFLRSSLVLFNSMTIGAKDVISTRRKINLKFICQQPTILFENEWKGLNIDYKLATIDADDTIQVVGPLIDAFTFMTPTKYAKTISCLTTDASLCPLGCTPRIMTNIIENITFKNNTEMLILLPHVVVRGNTFFRLSLTFKAPKNCIMEMDPKARPANHLNLYNITLKITKAYKGKSLGIFDNTMFSIPIHIRHLTVGFSGIESLNKMYSRATLREVSFIMPDDFDDFVIRNSYFVFGVGNAHKRVRSMIAYTVFVETNSQYIKFSTRDDELRNVPFVTMKKNGTCLFDGNWATTKCEERGALWGITELIMDGPFPYQIFTLDYDNVTHIEIESKNSLFVEKYCFYRRDETIDQCPYYTNKVMYSSAPLIMYGSSEVEIYITDTTSGDPLRLSSDLCYQKISIYSLFDTQYVVLDVQEAIEINLYDTKCRMFCNLTIDSVHLSNSIIMCCKKYRAVTRNLVADRVDTLVNSQQFSSDRYYLYGDFLKTVVLCDKGIKLIGDYFNVKIDVKPFTLIINQDLNITKDELMPAGAKYAIVPNIESHGKVKIFFEEKVWENEANDIGYITVPDGKITIKSNVPVKPDSIYIFPGDYEGGEVAFNIPEFIVNKYDEL